MDKHESIIVTLTTWAKRVSELPTVLDSIFSQSLPPDKVVLNMGYDELIPLNVQQYLDAHGIEINRVKDNKVYKKLIPTLRRYKDDCVICIDDDWIYPEGMIEDLYQSHLRHPDMPITGNYIVFKHLNCHCGCASLTKYSYYGDYLEVIDDEVIANCPSDDILFTYFAARSGHYYYRAKGTYFINMTPINTADPYSSRFSNPEAETWQYLSNRFGEVPSKKLHKYVAIVIMRRLHSIIR